MFIRLKSICSVGIDIFGVDIEINIFNRGLPYFDIVGLPDKAVSESKHRVKTAIINSGYEFPNKRILVNLAPANMPKQGSVYDFAIAAGIIACNDGFFQLRQLLVNSLLYGELSLDGSLRYVPGAQLLDIFAKEQGISNVFIPNECKPDLAKYIKKATYTTYLCDNLKQLKEPEKHVLSVNTVPISQQVDSYETIDLKNIIGNKKAKRTLEISAAGGHNLLFLGSPGVGKTTLAMAYKHIQPPLYSDEVMEVDRIYAVSKIHARGRSGGGFDDMNLTEKPFRAPHHTVSVSGLVGGGALLRPGEITLAHKGVLFLDELHEFSKNCIEALRQPLESDHISIVRSGVTYKLPCEFTLIATSNPCPCGFFGHPDNKCTCSQSQIKTFMRKLSGPIMDRLDIVLTIHKTVDHIYDSVTSSCVNNESSQEVRHRVCLARKIQNDRYKNHNFKCNARINIDNINTFCILSPPAKKYLDMYTQNLNISIRRYFKFLKLAKTIADLDCIDIIGEEHIAEATMLCETF